MTVCAIATMNPSTMSDHSNRYPVAGAGAGAGTVGGGGDGGHDHADTDTVVENDWNYRSHNLSRSRSRSCSHSSRSLHHISLNDILNHSLTEYNSNNNNNNNNSWMIRQQQEAYLEHGEPTEHPHDALQALEDELFQNFSALSFSRNSSCYSAISSSGEFDHVDSEDLADYLLPLSGQIYDVSNLAPDQAKESSYTHDKTKKKKGKKLPSNCSSSSDWDSPTQPLQKQQTQPPQLQYEPPLYPTLSSPGSQRMIQLEKKTASCLEDLYSSWYAVSLYKVPPKPPPPPPAAAAPLQQETQRHLYSHQQPSTTSVRSTRNMTMSGHSRSTNTTTVATAATTTTTNSSVLASFRREQQAHKQQKKQQQQQQLQEKCPSSLLSMSIDATCTQTNALGQPEQVLTMELEGGKKVPYFDASRTSYEIRRGNALRTQCFGCSSPLLCMGGVAYVICPGCHTVSPVTATATTTATTSPPTMSMLQRQWSSTSSQQQQQQQQYLLTRSSSSHSNHSSSSSSKHDLRGVGIGLRQPPLPPASLGRNP